MTILNIVSPIVLAVGMTFMSVALIVSVRTSRRAVKWNEQRTAEAVDRVVDGMFARLADDDAVTVAAESETTSE